MAITEADILGIAPDIQSSSSVIDTMITLAEDIVSDQIGSETRVSDTMEVHIIKFLAAHLLYMGPERQASRVSIGDIGETYGKLGLKLEATTYGQTVIMMDVTGTLAAMGKSTAEFAVIGKISNAEYD